MPNAKARLIVVPRWSGNADVDFYPWMVETLQAAGEVSEIRFASLKEPDAPRIEPTVDAVLDALGQDASTLARTVLMGHSVGAQAALRALARLDPATPISGALLVAAWWDVDQPWPSIRPWIDTPFDHARARSACRRLRVVLSDNDPFTADHAQTRRLFEQRLGAEVLVEPGAKHFNGNREEAVLRELRRLLAA